MIGWMITRLSLSMSSGIPLPFASRPEMELPVPRVPLLVYITAFVIGALNVNVILAGAFKVIRTFPPPVGVLVKRVPGATMYSASSGTGVSAGSSSSGISSTEV